ncbi:hypothetical protein GGTG_00285 [Gaeumannomyces tritici R3-111a-1]|uniref:Uncharacterized protein n=1 Tax=Gaeumannomyces tritici (strain R3-111a-1) TaxID=644352 RepID=J3NG93_GAET3|nr:hypothetical protein GGTG_00285 [Gaeumannomyces tritici R3-111a-1]EJT80283.1 hypothetical protein GGTG_00285 [Gaeumannomyces tritici R3-111a-1]
MPEATTTENTVPQEIGRTTSDEAEFEDIVPRPYVVPVMEEPKTVPWDIDISEADFKRLQVGFRPKEQDDKWYFLAMNPDEAGNLVFHIIRFFSRLTFYTFPIKPVDGGGRYKIDSLSWEQKVAIPRDGGGGHGARRGPLQMPS